MANSARGLIGQVILYLFPKDCFEELLIRYNFAHEECIRLVVSRWLGIGIILGSIFVQVPQIVKIMRAQSAQGVSFFSKVLELIGLTSTLAYSYAKQFPISAWGEAVFMILQTLTISFLVLHYNGAKTQAILFILAYMAVFTVLVSGLVSLPVLSALQALNIPIVISARLIQARINYVNGSTGQLSLITVFLLFAGSLARIFTSVQETGDQLTIITYAIAAAMNGLLLAQIWYYWGSVGRKKFV